MRNFTNLLRQGGQEKQQQQQQQQQPPQQHEQQPWAYEHGVTESSVEHKVVPVVDVVGVDGAVVEAQSQQEGEGLRAPKQPEWSPTTHQLLIMITLAVISLMTALDACVIVTSLSAIVVDLNGTATQGFWVGTSYLLSHAVSMPFLAALSQIFGRPLLLIFSIIMFAAGSAICCAAPNMSVLLGGRSIQGIGGGGVIVLSLVIFTDIVPLRYRPRWYGVVQGAWALGTCIGPVVGGVFAEKTTWRWNFYVMFPFCGFGLVAVPLLLTMKPKTETMLVKLGRVDWTGSFLFTASATSFLIAISWGGTQFAWKSAATIAPLIIGLAGLVATGFWERFYAKEPFLKHSLFHNTSALVTYICGAFQGLIIYGQLYYVPLYFQAIHHFTPIHQGVAILPVCAVLVPGSIITGMLVTRLNSFRWPIWLGWSLCTVACGMIMKFGRDTPVPYWAICFVILGFGHGSILNAQNFASQAICNPGEEGAAAGMYGFFRHFGTALGVGIGGTTFQNVMALKLSSEGLPHYIATNAEAFIPRVWALPDTDPEKSLVLDAYVHGFRGVFLVYLCLSAASLFLTIFIKHHDMNKEINTEQSLEENRISKMMDRHSVRSAKSSVHDDRSVKEEMTMHELKRHSSATSISTLGKALEVPKPVH